MVARRDERITRLALGSDNRGGRLKSGDDAPQLIETIRLDAIDPDPDQPRRVFDPDQLQELAHSLLSAGQIQPIIVVRQGDRFRIHVGERRWRASQLAGLTTVRAIVRATPLEAQAALIAQVTENEQRTALSTTELVGAVRALSGAGMKNVEIATALAKAPTRISELAALGEAPAELFALADTIGLGLSYQLLRQWRAHPQAALDFIAHMPADHISRLTIATIGEDAASTVPAPPVDGGAVPKAATADPAIKGRAGEGAAPRVSVSRLPITPAGPDGSTPTTPIAQAGALLVEHDLHGAGRVVFGIDAPVDHLAVRFADAIPLVLHKDEIRLLRTLRLDALDD
jgi:ParB/RepB/Spo0J family partition protein